MLAQYQIKRIRDHAAAGNEWTEAASISGIEHVTEKKFAPAPGYGSRFVFRLNSAGLTIAALADALDLVVNARP